MKGTAPVADRLLEHVADEGERLCQSLVAVALERVDGELVPEEGVVGVHAPFLADEDPGEDDDGLVAIGVLEDRLAELCEEMDHLDHNEVDEFVGVVEVVVDGALGERGDLGDPAHRARRQPLHGDH